MSDDALHGHSSRQTLAQRIVRSGGWTVFGDVASQALRLGGNLVLTRLLFPEAFGLMAIVQSVMAGIALLSDIGIGPSIVQHQRGAEPAFLNTAWTLQILRGVLIWLAIAALAHPIAVFYGEPSLTGLLVAAGAAALISGFNSVRLSLADRQVNARKVVLIELGSYVVSLVFTVLWAWIHPTVWALVWGGLFAALVKMLASHLFIGGERARLQLDPAAVRSIVSFGKWILLSSGLTFLLGEGNRLVIAALIDVRMLAFYALASTMSIAVVRVGNQVVQRVLFGAYSEIERTRPEALYRAVKRIRPFLLIPAWLAAVLFVLLGEPLMSFLYDDRYAESGWMLKILGVGLLASSIWLSYGGVLMAKGQVRTVTVVLVVEIILQLSAVLMGGHWFGATGVVVGFAAVNWLMYPVLAFTYARISMWQPAIDLPFLVMSGLIAGYVAFSWTSP